MLDLLHLPKSSPSNVDYFYNTGGSTSWQTWEKPRGIIMLEIICIGAGGGGRSGWCANSGTRSGGGGGGSGGFSRLLIPAIFLPDVLYVTVGKGGAGGVSITTSSSTTGMAGSDGAFSSVNIAPTNSAFYIVCYANGGAGAANLVLGANTAGSGGAVAVQTTALMSGLGQFFALAGQSGTAGATAAGVALAYPTTGLLLSGGGAGGGATIAAGSDITAPTQISFSLITTRTGGANALDGGSGADGISLSQPLMSIGGAGGGSSTTVGAGVGSGGRGGNGGLGCGGGGGGAGPSGTGSGAGGKGGDGLVIIRSW